MNLPEVNQTMELGAGARETRGPGQLRVSEMTPLTDCRRRRKGWLRQLCTATCTMEASNVHPLRGGDSEKQYDLAWRRV